MTFASARTVSVVITVKNDAEGAAQVLESLAVQSRRPDEIVVVDGGSRDATMKTLHDFARRLGNLRIITAPGTNIAAGRNRGVREARGEIIAVTDGGCRAHPDWLRNLVQPLFDDPTLDYVAGNYSATGLTLLEQVIALATMRGQLDPVDPQTFNPSARSMAMTRTVWQRVRGWPEWVNFSEDTLFDHQLRRIGARSAFAEGAVVDWRPRRSLRALARQFCAYGTGRGQTGIDAAGYWYNVRNGGLIIASLPTWLASWWCAVITALLIGYFGWWVHHRMSLRVMRRVKCVAAYPLTLAVMNVVAVAGAGGFLIGWWRQRRRCAATAPLDETSAQVGTV